MCSRMTRTTNSRYLSFLKGGDMYGSEEKGGKEKEKQVLEAELRDAHRKVKGAYSELAIALSTLDRVIRKVNTIPVS